LADRPDDKQDSSGRLYYGWYIVGAMFFTTTLMAGFRNGFGVFIPTWEEDFGVSVGLISVSAGIGWAVNGLVQPIFGRFTDSFGGRRVLIFSVTAVGLGTGLVAFVPNVYALIFVYGFVLSTAMGGVFPVPMLSLISRWFERKRGRAMSFVALGASIGGLLMVPLTGFLIELIDWRVIWAMVGAAILVLALPLLVMIVRSDPADIGLVRDGEATDDGRNTGISIPVRVAPLETSHWRESFHSAPMWQLSLAYWVCGITTAMIAVHYVTWAETEGVSTGTAALALGVLFAINGMGLIIVGWVSDHMPRKNLLGAVYWIRGLAFLSLIFLSGTTALWTFAILGGASWLATVSLTTALTADVYGTRNVGMINGLINMAHQLGGGLAVIVAGFVFDAWDTYDPAFAGGAAFLFLAGTASFAIRERRYSVRYQPPSIPPVSVGAAASDGD